jgi:monofunctional biosynthetic peptidoglycan transglycosylase
MKLPKLPQKWHKKIILSLGCTLAVLFIYDSFLPPISTLMLARYVTFSHTEREFVPLSHISRSVIRAVIAAEDGQFCNHAGVDTKA